MNPVIGLPVMNRQCWATSKACLHELILRVASILYSRSHWNNLEHVLTTLMTTLSSCFKKKFPIYDLFLENYDNIVNPPQLSLLTASALPKFQFVELIQAFGFRSTQYCRTKIWKKTQLTIFFLYSLQAEERLHEASKSHSPVSPFDKRRQLSEDP